MSFLRDNCISKIKYHIRHRNTFVKLIKCSKNVTVKLALKLHSTISGDVHGGVFKRAAESDDLSDEDALAQLLEQIDADRIGDFIEFVFIQL